MGPHIRIAGARNGQAIPLPQDLDAITITTEQGTIYIDLAEQIRDMVLMRASVGSIGSDVARLIVSPMESGRLSSDELGLSAKLDLVSTEGVGPRGFSPGRR